VADRTDLKRFRAPTIAGPVGLSFALAGYSAAVIVARAFVSLIAHCTQSCPAIRIEGFHLHHFYYGLGLVLLSVAALSLVENIRSRWDVTLVLGIGTGLMIDEVGLLPGSPILGPGVPNSGSGLRTLTGPWTRLCASRTRNVRFLIP